TFYTFVLLLVFFIDLEQRLILNEVVLIAGLAALLLSPFIPGLTWLRALLGGLSYGGVFALLYLLAWALYRRDDALGLGDVKLSILLGLMTGIPRVWVALSLAVLLGALVGLGLLLAGRGARAFMPYGTSMAVGAFLALLWGEELWNWYTVASTA
ncbi:MAG: prepilin peptidase, partial [Chloroflexi bacterium]|nr:prepilin peptidase [Chloroflexota bacterium]